MTLPTKPLTNEEILIAKIQREFIADGFQFQEHIYNDHNSGLSNCSIRITKTTSPHAFNPGQDREPDVGWGRFYRVDAWMMAHDWLLDYRRREAKAKLKSEFNAELQTKHNPERNSEQNPEQQS